MHDEHPHPLLAQLPLTVSPFLSLPQPTPLPYTYKTLPSTLPPSIISSADTKPSYITSSTGHTAAPTDLIASCRALQSHLAKTEADARGKVEAWERERRERELAEKRRVAPGWLDQEVRMLVPERRYTGADDQGHVEGGGGEGGSASAQGGQVVATQSREAEELDKAFGGMGLR